MAENAPRIAWVADSALRCEFAARGLMAANRAARELRDAIEAARFDEVEDLVPGATSLLVLLRPGIDPSSALLRALEAPLEAASDRPGVAVHEIEVAYGGAGGPDLADLARTIGLREREVVAKHVATLYTVGFLGFSPGFAYLLGLPGELHAPRLSTPRTRVPGGSVAIGGAFTGVYPRATPGGWRILGSANAALFDPQAEPASRLRPGDRVRFVAR